MLRWYGAVFKRGSGNGRTVTVLPLPVAWSLALDLIAFVFNDSQGVMSRKHFWETEIMLAPYCLNKKLALGFIRSTVPVVDSNSHSHSVAVTKTNDYCTTGARVNDCFSPKLNLFSVMYNLIVLHI